MRGGYSRVGRGEEAGEEVAERGGHSRVMIYDDEEGGGNQEQETGAAGQKPQDPRISAGSISNTADLDCTI